MHPSERMDRGLKYRVIGIPDILQRRPQISAANIALEKLEGIMEQEDQAILPVAGDCLEAAGVDDGGWVAIDFTRRPAPPRYKSKGGDGSVDLCLCYATFPGMKIPTVMCKAYSGLWGPWHMVGTQYANQWVGDDYRMNVGFHAIKIFGVIFASWDRDGRLKWKRDPHEFPEELSTVPSIHGVNCGDPEAIR